MRIHARSAEETRAFAAKIAAELQGGEILLLEGDLGAGKTTFTQGLTEALGADLARSPTFSLLNVYPVIRPNAAGIRQIVHLDFYRLKRAEELRQFGLEEWLGRLDTVVVIEWPNAVDGVQWKQARSVQFKVLSPTERQITYR